MRRLVIPFVCVALLLLAVPSFATLLPGYGNSFTIDLYETVNNKPDGPAAEFSKVELKEDVVLGNVWLWETLPADPALRTKDLFGSINPATGLLWGSDVLNFFAPAPPAAHTMVSFWSDGAETALLPDRSGNAVDFLEPPSGFFQYIAGANVYNIHSDFNEVPLPPAFYLLGSGLLGLIGLRRKVRS